MAAPKLTQLELRIMEALWTSGPRSVREIQQTFPESERPAYTTVQTMVYRLERKRALRRARKISNAHIFEATLTRDAAQGRCVDELLSMFGSRMQPLMTHLIESGRLTLKDVKEAEDTLRKWAKRKGATPALQGQSREDGPESTVSKRVPAQEVTADD
jgi:predicted transcriptional regulator